MALRDFEVVGDLPEERLVLLALKHLAEKIPAGPKELSRDLEREPPEADAPRVVEGPVSTEARGHVAEDDVRLADAGGERLHGDGVL